MAKKSWREQWLQEQQQLAAERERRRQERAWQQRLEQEQRRENAAERLHQFCEQLGLTELELAELLANELEWYLPNAFYEVAEEG